MGVPDELLRLDDDLSAGRIDATSYRERRDELLAAASAHTAPAPHPERPVLRAVPAVTLDTLDDTELDAAELELELGDGPARAGDVAPGALWSAPTRPTRPASPHSAPVRPPAPPPLTPAPPTDPRSVHREPTPAPPARPASTQPPAASVSVARNAQPAAPAASGATTGPVASRVPGTDSGPGSESVPGIADTPDSDATEIPDPPDVALTAEDLEPAPSTPGPRPLGSAVAPPLPEPRRPAPPSLRPPPPPAQPPEPDAFPLQDPFPPPFRWGRGVASSPETTQVVPTTLAPGPGEPERTQVVSSSSERSSTSGPPGWSVDASSAATQVVRPSPILSPPLSTPPPSTSPPWPAPAAETQVVPGTALARVSTAPPSATVPPWGGREPARRQGAELFARSGRPQPATLISTFAVVLVAALVLVLSVVL